MEIRILDPRLSVPEYATTGSAAFDLRACSSMGEKLSEGVEIVIPAGDTIMVGTGIAVDLSTYSNLGLAGLVMPRSGIGCNQGLVPGNLVGLIDSDYHGEIKICLWNRGREAQSIKALDRIAQLLIVPAFRPVFRVVEQFSRDTDRGANGFGSTGK